MERYVVGSDEYFFCEWLIIAKHMTREQYEGLTATELGDLVAEYKKFEGALK